MFVEVYRIFVPIIIYSLGIVRGLRFSCISMMHYSGCHGMGTASQEGVPKLNIHHTDKQVPTKPNKNYYNSSTSHSILASSTGTCGLSACVKILTIISTQELLVMSLPCMLCMLL